MACNTNINIMLAASVFFRLLILAILIFVAITYFGSGQSAGNRALIAVAVVIVYGMTDCLLNILLGLACSCRDHNGNSTCSAK